MKLLLDVKDEKAAFFLEVLRNFKFVKTKELTPYNSEVLEGIKQAVEELKLIKAGKLQARAAKELINEL